MKTRLILSLMLVSVSAYSQSMKAQAKPKATTTSPKVVIEEKASEVPCDDTKEDILKKLEEKKKEQAKANKGFNLQGGNDTGCTIK